MLKIKTIRKFITPTIKLIASLFHCIYGYKASRKLSLFANYLYSCWIVNDFKCVGKGAVIYRLSRLEGGKHISVGCNTVIGKIQC